MPRYVIPDGEPSPTPDHNELQALFLDDNFCVRFTYAALWDERPEARTVIKRQFEHNDIDVVFETGDQPDMNPRLVFSIEIKTKVGDEYPAILRQIRRQHVEEPFSKDVRLIKCLFLEKFRSSVISKEQFVKIFEEADIRVVFKFT